MPRMHLLILFLLALPTLSLAQTAPTLKTSKPNADTILFDF